MIFGMKVSVTSCTWVNACSRAMTTPTAIAAADRRPAGDDHRPKRRLNDIEGIGLVHGSCNRDAGAEHEPALAVVQERHGAVRGHLTDMTVPATVPSAEMIVRPMKPSACDSASDVIMASSLALVLTRLLDAREGRELGDELGRIHRLGRVLVLHLGDEQPQERVVVERRGRCIGGRRRRAGGPMAGLVAVTCMTADISPRLLARLASLADRREWPWTLR